MSAPKPCNVDGLVASSPPSASAGLLRRRLRRFFRRGSPSSSDEASPPAALLRRPPLPQGLGAFCLAPSPSEAPAELSPVDTPTPKDDGAWSAGGPPASPAGVLDLVFGDSEASEEGAVVPDAGSRSAPGVAGSLIELSCQAEASTRGSPPQRAERHPRGGVSEIVRTRVEARGRSSAPSRSGCTGKGTGELRGSGAASMPALSPQVSPPPWVGSGSAPPGRVPDAVASTWAVDTMTNSTGHRIHQSGNRGRPRRAARRGRLQGW